MIVTRCNLQSSFCVIAQKYIKERVLNWSFPYAVLTTSCVTAVLNIVVIRIHARVSGIGSYKSQVDTPSSYLYRPVT
jgi:hypothetical protein